MRFLALLLVSLFSLYTASADARTGADRADSIYNGTEYVAPGVESFVAAHTVRRSVAHKAHRVRHRNRSQDEVVRQKPPAAITAEQAIAMEDISRLPSMAVAAVVKAIDKAVSLVERAYQFFLDKGYTHVQVAGILGHIRAESNFNTRDRGDGGLARFLAQWHPDRQAGLKKLARETGRDPYDYDVNLEWIDLELRTEEALAYRKLREANDVEDATTAFAHYERPFGYRTNCPRCTHDYRLRLRFAYNYFNEYKHLQPRQIGAAL